MCFRIKIYYISFTHIFNTCIKKMYTICINRHNCDLLFLLLKRNIYNVVGAAVAAPAFLDKLSATLQRRPHAPHSRALLVRDRINAHAQVGTFRNLLNKKQIPIF